MFHVNMLRRSLNLVRAEAPSAKGNFRSREG